jgi:hypothetical protein
MPFFLNQADRTAFGVATQGVKAARSGVFRSMTLGTMAGLPILAMEAGSAQKGEVIPTLLGGSVGLMAYPAMSSALAAGGAALAAAMGIAVPGIGWIAAAAALYPEVIAGNSISRGIRELTVAGQQIRHLEMGGHYTDTASASRLRDQALYEMSGATSAARRYLGQEAYFLHR